MINLFDYIALKQYLDDKGLKQKFIAEKTGISEAALSSILMDKRKCSLDEYIKLCQFLNVPFMSFIKYIIPAQTA